MAGDYSDSPATCCHDLHRTALGRKSLTAYALPASSFPPAWCRNDKPLITIYPAPDSRTPLWPTTLTVTGTKSRKSTIMSLLRDRAPRANLPADSACREFAGQQGHATQSWIGFYTGATQHIGYVSQESQPYSRHR